VRYLAHLLTIVAIASISSSIAGAASIIESLDPDFNYELKFSSMPEPMPEVVHSRVERETSRRLFWIIPLPPRNVEWEFELVATPSWIATLRKEFKPANWEQLEKRERLPEWFSPGPEVFSVWYLPGTSGIHAAHLFIERAPRDPSRVHVFIRRH
jgi:hypothetical protein